jgi:AcrR family transcriptional regulator
MSKNKLKLLQAAIALYNREGVSSVSIRQLAREVGISHSNLIYHYPTQEDLLLALHDLLLQKAMDLNKTLAHDESPLISLYETTKTGFYIVHDFRFFFLELHYISNSFPRIKEVLRKVEELRANMYMNTIEILNAKDMMRNEEFDHEFDHLITRIKIFSDHWLESSSIYDKLPSEEMINKYAFLLLQHFYPYLTEKGKKEFKRIQLTEPKPL